MLVNKSKWAFFHSTLQYCRCLRRFLSGKNKKTKKQKKFRSNFWKITSERFFFFFKVTITTTIRIQLEVAADLGSLFFSVFFFFYNVSTSSFPRFFFLRAWIRIFIFIFKKKNHTCLTACFKYSRTHERTSSGFSTDTSVVTLTHTHTLATPTHSYTVSQTHTSIYTLCPALLSPIFLHIFSSLRHSLSPSRPSFS